MSKFVRGDRVVNPDFPDWGMGQVLSDEADGRVTVFFMDAGDKTLMLSHARLSKVTGHEAKSLFLDNLAIERDGEAKGFRSINEAMASFHKIFPGGFKGKKFAEWERDYKVDGHQLMLGLLDKQEFAKLLDKVNYTEICDRALKVVNKLNLIFPNEKMALKDGLKLPVNQQAFAERLYALLYGDDDMKRRFEAFAICLANLGAAKWPIVSYFQFIRFPDRFMFVKPMVTQNAANIIGFELHYSSELNWQTYDAVQKLAKYLKGRLSDMKPTDMIDVQTFMWCIDSAVYDQYLKDIRTAESV